MTEPRICRLLTFKLVCIVFVLCAGKAVASPTKTTFKTLVRFDGTNGAVPCCLMSLIQGTDGNLYGTTNAGGTYEYCQYVPCGTVFRITPGGRLTTLYTFSADGVLPYSGLVQAADGNFYGTTSEGGEGGASNGGTVFKITSAGMLTTLYTFCAQFGCPDGSFPTATLMQATDGNFYGITASGGANDYGTIFKITTKGALTTLYNFNSTDGGATGLVQATDGNFYGTTYAGGANQQGTVFRITPRGELTTLYTFCTLTNCADGSFPFGALIQATDGNLYGTTSHHGVGGGGTVFRVTLEGKLTTLYSFCARTNCVDGSAPWAGLVQATDGNFYGATALGGASAWGTIFKVTPGGKLTTLHSFDLTDGYQTYGNLAQDTDGSLYGTTAFGGTSDDGTIFWVCVGLRPFVETRPTSGKVGTNVIIVGNNLKDATSVAFNDTEAQFKVVSGTEIKTSVPTGASTGYVTVTTPKKNLKSNVVFRVTK